MKTKEVGAVIAALLLVATTLAISVASAESMSPFDTANQNPFFDVPYPTNGKITPGFNPQYGLPSEYPAEYFKPNPIFDWMQTSPWNADYRETPNSLFDWMRTSPGNADYSKPETWRGMDPFGNSNTKGD